MFKKIDHVGVIVKDIEESTKLFCDTFGFQKNSDSASVDSGGQFKSIVITNGEVKMELLSPINSASPLSGFLEKRGEGIHHISIEVDNIDRELNSLKAKGKRLINEKAEVVDKQRVAFIHPGSSNGVLIELTQKP